MEIYHSVSLCEYYYINGDYYFVSVTDKWLVSGIYDNDDDDADDAVDDAH